MFESETPGLIHRHALDYIFYQRFDISPPRQARIWMALDAAIYAALAAAWSYKWSRDRRISYRWRPSESAGPAAGRRGSPRGRSACGRSLEGSGEAEVLRALHREHGLERVVGERLGALLAFAPPDAASNWSKSMGP